jgi:hypothetical protein
MNRRDYLKNTSAVLGIALSGVSMSALFVACEKEAKLTWKPVFLKPNHAELVAEIAETILPKTNTPGAKDLGVPQFIDKFIDATKDENDKAEFVKGIEDFEDRCKEKYNKSFVELDAKQRIEYLMIHEKESPKTGMSLWGINLEPNAPKPTFYKTLKSLTLFGFYTSEKVGRNILAFQDVPGEFIGCIPYKGQNAWNE